MGTNGTRTDTVPVALWLYVVGALGLGLSALYGYLGVLLVLLAFSPSVRRRLLG